MQFDRLLVEYMAPCNGPSGGSPTLENVAYLAQHPLFEHIPNLRHDIAVPHYAKQFLSSVSWACARRCKLQESYETLLLKFAAGEPHINTWIGTAGTVTPLHTDTYDNILAQVLEYRTFSILFGPLISILCRACRKKVLTM